MYLFNKKFQKVTFKLWRGTQGHLDEAELEGWLPIQLTFFYIHYFHLSNFNFFTCGV